MDGENKREDIYSEAVRAGKRTYFFDVKSTKNNDYYLTVTESKKRFNDDGSHFYEKHKLFLYKEDFEKFIEGLQAAIDKIDSLKSSASENHSQPSSVSSESDSYTDISFEDLDK